MSVGGRSICETGIQGGEQKSGSVTSCRSNRLQRTSTRVKYYVMQVKTRSVYVSINSEVTKELLLFGMMGYDGKVVVSSDHKPRRAGFFMQVRDEDEIF